MAALTSSLARSVIPGEVGPGRTELTLMPRSPSSLAQEPPEKDTPARRHATACLAGAQCGAAHVHGVYGVELRRRQRLEARHHAGAGVVDQQVHTIEGAEKLFYLQGIGYVGLCECRGDA